MLWRARSASLYITGVWGQSPQRGPGAEPLVEGQGGEAPLKLKAFQFLDVKRRQQICPFFAFWELDWHNALGKKASKNKGVAKIADRSVTTWRRHGPFPHARQ